ncbi:hypothetical protein C3F09_00065 [candidate division GN15 bacterium]|uniref:D,D-heptose 1,7-bisphosphate phosphatase n=1 Tax=candidate division GN15 bacterium TaxID=2072418 RepID=A0A855XCC1_9BACT|nr:MAG: hypothetical protein C3F09_00065 [candidate division GN15 bacterium]
MTRHILVIRLGSLGDVILTSPAVLNLKIAHPGSKLVFLTKERFGEVARMIPGVDEVRTIPERIGSTDLYRLVLDLDRTNFDIVVDLHGNFRSWFVRTLLGSSQSNVYPKRRLERWLIVHRKQFPREDQHTIDLYNALISRNGLPTPSRRPILMIADPNQNHFMRSRENVVVIAPGAAHENKKWPIERFSEVARALHRRFGSKIAWVVTRDDAGIHNLDSLPEGSFVELVDAPIPTVAEVMAGARLSIANDSGLAHLSSAVGTPVIAVFGPTHPALGFAPRGLFDVVAEIDEYCRPCSLHGKTPCFRTERFCMTRLSTNDVLERAVRLFESPVNVERALFVDRDGTIAVERHYVSNPDEIELIPGAAQALRRARDAGFKIVVVSNQSGVARGHFGIDAVERTNARLRSLLRNEGVEPDLMLYCPHHPHGSISGYSFACACRKPAPGMAEQAAIELGIDLRRSYVIGDKIDDVTMASVMGGSAILVRTGYGSDSEARLSGLVQPRGLAVCDNLAGAVDEILKRS